MNSQPSASNQFFNCDGIGRNIDKTEDVKLDDYSYAYVGINTDTEIQVRFTSTAPAQARMQLREESLMITSREPRAKVPYSRHRHTLCLILRRPKRHFLAQLFNGYDF